MPLTVLVVDDDPAICLAVSDFLELSGYGVIAAGNGQQAWDMVQQYRPHLIVTDIKMPHMDGFELVRRVRQQPAFRLLPVVFLTAKTQTEERIQGYRVGGDVYLPKPFDLEELGAVVRNLLDRSQIIQTELQVRTQPLATDTVSQEVVSGLELTAREKDVLTLLTQGLSNAQIGERLHLSPRTIEKYVSKLLQKTATSNRAEIVRFALEHHLVEAGTEQRESRSASQSSLDNVIDLRKHRVADQSRR